jgi:hypothetical protein
MTHNKSNPMDIWLRHIRALAEDIGPRGSTSEEERQAAEYCRRVIADLGIVPQVEVFQSATTLFGLHVLVAIGMIASFFIYPLGGRAGAALALALGLFCVGSQSLELLFRNNPIRRLLPRAASQNVIATIAPSGEHRQDIILMGHLDTNHCGLIFRSVRAINAMRIISALFGFASYVQLVLYAVGLVTQAAWLWPWAMLPAVISAGLLGIVMLEAELAPLSAGANDNATGAGLVLTLGEQLLNSPLRHTRVWLACTGCEEVKHYGAEDFLKRHITELVRPHAIVFEMLGRDGPGYLLRESTINVYTFRASPEMVTLAEAVAHQHPELGAHPTQIEGGHSEMANAILAGVPAITIAGIDEGGTRFGYDGTNLYWHHTDDVIDNLIPDVMARNYAYVWELIQAIDAQEASQAREDEDRSEVVEPRTIFPAGVRLIRSRYPKSNTQEPQQKDTDRVKDV